VRGEFDINPNLTIYGAYGGRRFDDNYLFPFGFGLTSSGNFTEGFAYASSWYRNTSAEAGLRGSFETGPIKHRASIAITDFNQDSGVLSGAAPINPSNIYNPTSIPQPNLAGLSNVGKTGQLDLSSVAIADTLSIAEDKLQLTLGLRKQQVKINAFNGTPGYDKEAVTPALGIVVKPWQKIAFYGNYIEGLSQGPTAPITAFNAGQIFAPFKSKQQEVGAKFDFGTLATTVSLFQITKPSGLTNPATNIFSVDGEQRNRGVELNIFGAVASGVRILGGGMLLDGKQTKTANGTFDGKNALNTPKVTLNLGGEWDTSLIQGLTLSARAIYTDSAYIDAANTQQIPSWTRFDAGARYALNTLKTPITVRANVENVFDRTYWMSSSLYRGNPRTLTLSATIDF
jgi:iron complex outermembrane receptor protein